MMGTGSDARAKAEKSAEKVVESLLLVEKLAYARAVSDVVEELHGLSPAALADLIAGEELERAEEVCVEELGVMFAKHVAKWAADRKAGT